MTLLKHSVSPLGTIQVASACWPLASAEAAASVANSASCYDRIENIWILSVVEPERKLIQIQRQIFTAHVMIVADDSAFQQAPKVLNRVRVNGADNILMLGMVHGLMLLPPMQN